MVSTNYNSKCIIYYSSCVGFFDVVYDGKRVGEGLCINDVTCYDGKGLCIDVMGKGWEKGYVLMM